MGLDAHPRDKENFFMLTLGAEQFRQLEITANMRVGARKVDLALLLIFYKEQIKKLEG